MMDREITSESIVEFHNTPENRHKLLEFLLRIDEDFQPKLSDRVKLLEYAEKLLSKADCLAIYLNGGIEAFAATYCNDLKARTAFLSLIALGGSLRKRGVGRLMLDEIVGRARNFGMEAVELETDDNNQAALKLYRTYGFEPVGLEERGITRMHYVIPSGEV